jgi:hypothetical protein
LCLEKNEKINTEHVNDALMGHLKTNYQKIQKGKEDYDDEF